MGIRNDAPSACAYDRAWRRRRPRWEALGIDSACVPAAGARSRTAVPPAFPDSAAGAIRCPPTQLLWDDGHARRTAELPSHSVAGPGEARVGVCQAALLWDRGQ